MSATEILASVDIVALRLNADNQLQVLLIRREREPYIEQWALPGVVINGRSADLNLEAAAARALHSKAKVTPHYMEQVGTVGNSVRDPRGWSMSTVYLALVPSSAELADERLQFIPLAHIVNREMPLPFDHCQLIQQAAERLTSKAVYTSLPLYLLEPRFTVLEAMSAFTACLNQRLQNTSLRRRLERMKQDGWLEDTAELRYPKLGRPQSVLLHTPKTTRGMGAGLYTFERSVLA